MLHNLNVHLTWLNHTFIVLVFVFTWKSLNVYSPNAMGKELAQRWYQMFLCHTFSWNSAFKNLQGLEETIC